MQVTLITLQDLELFKKELLVEIRRLLALPEERSQSSQLKYLKSVEVEKILRLSRGKLHGLRRNGTIKATQIGRTYYYKEEDILQLMKQYK